MRRRDLLEAALKSDPAGVYRNAASGLRLEKS
jgi:hypothetical protein